MSFLPEKRACCKNNQSQDNQGIADHQQGKSSAPLGASPVVQETIHRVVNNINEGINKKKYQRSVGGFEPQRVYIINSCIGLEKIDVNGRDKHP